MDVDEPTVTAAAAARTAGVTIVDGRELTRDDLQALAELFGRVWGRDAVTMGSSIVSPEILWATSHAGAPVAAARVDGDLVGGIVGFVGVRDDELVVHSHLAGVTPTRTGRGIGQAMKWHQRAWCLAHGINVVEWTFDPLVRRNAVLNLLVLGARPVAFVEDLYGPMVDIRNAGLPTDRFLVRWQLDSARVIHAAAGRPAEPDIEGLRRAGAERVLDVRADGMPVLTGSQAARRLVRTPPDIEALRAQDPAVAAAWGTALRRTVGLALEEGFHVAGITRDGWYVLTGGNGVSELA